MTSCWRLRKLPWTTTGETGNGGKIMVQEVVEGDGEHEIVACVRVGQ